jgi:hypothetical protein
LKKLNVLVLMLGVLFASQGFAQGKVAKRLRPSRQPVIDMHIHARSVTEFGGGCVPGCVGDKKLIAWPGSIGRAIESVEKAPFPDKEQKRDIFYNNAARFLRLTPAEIAADHR